MRPERNVTATDLIAFEQKIAALWEAGELPFLIHLSGGNEDELVRRWHEEIRPGDWVFSTHRNHYHALLHGVPPDRLEALIRAGKSMFVYDRARNFFTSSILAGTCGIAAGVAWALKRRGASGRVWCFLGDGAEEQGHFYEAALFVEANDLPCRLVIEDNDRQVDTPLADRRGPANPFSRMTHHPLLWFRCVRRYRYRATYPHAGNGCKQKIVFNPEVVARHAAAAR